MDDDMHDEFSQQMLDRMDDILFDLQFVPSNLGSLVDRHAARDAIIDLFRN